MRRSSSWLAAGAIVLSLGVTVPVQAQSIVFDPNNYVQNVLTAARALQQINNQITSLQNQAQMLINQARNLANLPYSSLQQLQLSIQRTQQLLAQAQRIAYDVQQIDRAFSTSYAPVTGSQSSPPGSGRRRRQPRHQPHSDVGACDVEPRCQWRPSGNASRQSDPRASGATTRRFHGCFRGSGQGAES